MKIYVTASWLYFQTDEWLIARLDLSVVFCDFQYFWLNMHLHTVTATPTCHNILPASVYTAGQIATPSVIYLERQASETRE